MRKIVSVLAIPALLCLTGCITYLSIRRGWNEDLVIAGIIVLVLGYLHLCERIIPLKSDWQQYRRDFKSDSFYLIIAGIFSAIGKVASLSIVLHLHDFFGLEWRFWQEMHFIPAFIIANLIGELIPYLYHRVSHVANENSPFSMFLWRTHAIHHIPPRLSWLKTNWMHPINLFVNTFGKLFPLQLLGFSKEIVFAVGVTNIVVAYVSHANITARTGFLDYVIATPRVHHFHHSVRMEEAKNYANILPFWDIVFGTYFNNGQAVNKVGVVEGTESKYPQLTQVWRHLQFPFKMRTQKEGVHENLGHYSDT